MHNQEKIGDLLNEQLDNTDLADIKNNIKSLKQSLPKNKKDNYGLIKSTSNEDVVNIKYLETELNQILVTKTIERTKYYIIRLIKGLTANKTNKINDLNLHRWKEYDDILTDSLWLLDKRDNSGAHNAGYWGNFIPQIPNQFLRRYTKQNEWVLDTFLGSGTTLIECKRLNRNGIGIELQDNVASLAKSNIEKEKIKSDKNVTLNVITADSVTLDYKKELKKAGIKSVQFLFMHPPYWDIIKFSDNSKDLSNACNVKKFLKLFGRIVDKTYSVLDHGRYMALIIGDKYFDGEWIPLAFYTMQEVLKRGYKLKSTIIKNFEETKGKQNKKELWRYRALVGGYYIFKHEYIFLFQKENKKI
jgi:16S rRNA G966 N2-methylase RsmD